ncbi:MAG TPA: hypothetical protein DEB39_06325 [Planctomycetaceae bacterium]|nr:hypothetical protein [Planctomycetaceae bacterium]
MSQLCYDNLLPAGAATLVQQHGLEAVVVNPPALPMSEREMDRIYGLPFTRKPHPAYGKEEIPAYAMIRNSITIHRGCFGGCAFCSIAAHQGKVIQSRSEKSICEEVRKVLGENTGSGKRENERDVKRGIISDLGGPSANMYKLGCANEAAQKRCRRLSCLVPEACANLDVDHAAVIKLMRKVRAIAGVGQVFIASGVRTDLALLDPRYIDELVRHHVGGHLKTAPEHTDPYVLALANKPPIENYDAFCALFREASRNAGKEQYLVPYLIAGLPGSTLRSMVEVALYLKANHIRPEQVQEFIPGPFELAGCMYYTGIDPTSGKEVYTAHGQRERRLQKALLLYHDPAYYHDVKSALKEAHREDLIGDGPNCLIPSRPPSKEHALRQTSRVKRLRRNQARDRIVAEQKRAQFLEESRPPIKPPLKPPFQKTQRPRTQSGDEKRPERFEHRERQEFRERRERPQRDGERSSERASGRSPERREHRSGSGPQRPGASDSSTGGDRRFGRGTKPERRPQGKNGPKGGPRRPS